MAPVKFCPICNSNDVIYERTINEIPLSRCRVCTIVYANLTDDQINAWNASCDTGFAERQKERQTLLDFVWFELLARKIQKAVPRGRILDIGCGNGILLKHFLGAEWSAYGLDFSPWAKKYAEIYGYQLIDHDLEKTDFPNGYFDIITSISTLEHIPKPLAHVSKVMKLLKPGGLAFFSGIPNYGSLSIRLNLSNFYQNLPPGHSNYFTYDTLHRLLTHNNVSQEVQKISISTYGIPELHRAYSLARKWARKILTRPPQNSSDKSSVEGQNDRPTAMGSPAATMLVDLYYYLGKPFHWGSKLEALVIKNGK